MPKFYKKPNYGRKFFKLVLICFLIYAASLVWFLDKAQSYKPENLTKQDAVVILTGEAPRLSAGMGLLEKRYAKAAFITGVNKSVDKNTLIKSGKGRRRDWNCCVTLDYRATNTIENATQTFDWLVSKRYKSFWLVTTDYHMPRALLEHKHHLGEGYQIHPYPVTINQISLAEPWVMEPYFIQTVLMEHLKYMARTILLIFD